MTATTPRLVLLVGAPRSGTTWLQAILGSHAAIGTPQETDLFRLYVGRLYEAWDDQLHGATADPDGQRRKGLPLLLTEADFDAAVRALVEQTLAAVERLKPGISVVVEKSPAHARCVAPILRCWPDAAFIHLVRDGRDVADSLRAASAEWGNRWAPADVARGAQVWVDHVRGARDAAHAPGGYVELRYEALRHGDTEALARAFAVCGVTVDEARCAELLDEHSFTRMQASGQVSSSILTGGAAGASELARREPAGFFRRGEVGGWSEQWSAAERRAFAAVGGGLLVELGYEPDGSWAGPAVDPPAAARVGRRALRASARALRGLARRADDLADPQVGWRGTRLGRRSDP
ncbi:MAG TPA: sulfotransferase [Acidimicrobiia bacterium]|nr:sulfotransferase [Acidimicrobiia bacterium]